MHLAIINITKAKLAILGAIENIMENYNVDIREGH